MSRKKILLVNLLGGLLLAAGLTLWISSPAKAQCDEPQRSSCIVCHEKEMPVYKNGEWHGIHALKDCCTNCHGGNCRASDKDLAHESLVSHPLDDIYTNCYRCHPTDYARRAGRFAGILGIVPSSSATATPMPTSPPVENAIVILPPSAHKAAFMVPEIVMFSVAALAVLVLMILGFLALRNKRHEFEDIIGDAKNL